MLLVVVFGTRKPCIGKDLCLYVLPRPLDKQIAGLFRYLSLPVIVIEQDILVLPRPGPARRIVLIPENINDLFKRNDGWVVIDLDGFGVIANVPVGRVSSSSSRVTDAGPNDTG